MIVQLELWHLVSLVVIFAGGVAGFAKLVVSQFDKRLEDRHKAQDEQRMESSKRWQRNFDELRELAHRNATEMGELEKDMLRLKADLPLHYVRREDWIRFGAVIETKIDKAMELIEKLVGRKKDA